MSGDVRWFGDSVIDAAQNAVSKGMDRLAEGIAETARSSMMNTAHKGEDTRATYKRGKREGQRKGRDKRPSQDYHPPAVQQAVLLRSVQWKRTGPLTRKVGTNLLYGLYLELGTRKMNPRPWLRPALYKHTGRTGDYLWEGLLK